MSFFPSPLCLQNPGVDFGDVSERVELRKRLQCRSFRWYLEHVYPEMRIYNNTITYGEVRELFCPPFLVSPFILCMFIHLFVHLCVYFFSYLLSHFIYFPSLVFTYFLSFFLFLFFLCLYFFPSAVTALK